MVPAGMTDVGVGYAHPDMHGLFCLVLLVTGILPLVLLLSRHRTVPDINSLLLIRHRRVADILALLVLVDRHSLHVCPT